MSFRIYGQNAPESLVQGSTTSPTPRGRQPLPVVQQSFRYQELEALPHTVRLLLLHPFAFSTDEPIRCNLVHTDLKSQDCKFIALSYCWGNSAAELPLFLNGDVFLVTESLWNALLSLRPKPGAEPIPLWADAICINQQNVPERNMQVQLMTEIYGAAEYVAVHLGPETNTTTLALAQLEVMAEAQAAHDSQNGDTTTIPSMINGTEKGNELYLRWQALVEFLALDYWHRLWIVQEIILSRSAVMYCGTPARVIPWASYQKAMACLTRHSKLLLKFHFMDGYAIPRMNRTWYGVMAAHMESRLEPRGRNSGRTDGVDFVGLMERHRYRKCGEPKDKIYGMLGLVPPEQRHLVEVDYGASLTKVFTGFAGAMIQSTQRLDIICFTRHSPVYERPDRLPSWVPDWAYQRESLSIRSTTVVRLDASRGRRQAPQDLVISGGGYRLCIRGVYIDSVRLCSVTCSLPWNNSGLLLALVSSWMMVHVGASGLKVREETANAGEQFCEAVIFGSGPRLFGQDEYLDKMLQTFRTHQRTDSGYVPLPSTVFEPSSKVKAPVGEAYELGDAVSREIWSLAGNCLAGRRTFITRDQGLLGVGSGYLGNGDVVCVPLGCDTPIVLRALGNGEYKFVSDAYVCGYMDGRAIEELDERRKELQEFVLV
ncbi:heterokaryon incompatibility protein-domain-containing protein [Apodospora peruviana]|uniref:Heterokaryon incompatibility protein-domain-containing protein n=1 Tax=Apodospora peruviana TaxID=516989 RepID=A0AAE0I1K2_9PEZI|nr:heterokaryon incompatibility protein-domain-containing protein [Apodospora peruviana]